MRHYVELVLLAALWGASFLFLRISSPEFGPIALIFVRTALAAVVLLPFLIHQGKLWQLARHWRAFTLLGAASTALPFSLFAYASLFMPAGKTAILNATTPFFSAILAFFILGERLSKIGIAGLLIGFYGVYRLSFDDDVGGTTAALPWLPVAGVLLATFCYAISSIFSKLRLADLPPLTIASGSQVFAALLLLPLALVFWPAQLPSPAAWGGALCLAVFSTSFAVIIFFRMLQNVGVTKTVAVTYLIPVFGMLWGRIFLNEPLTLAMMSSAGLILCGVALTLGMPRR